jgi:hypothetical protein
MDWSRVVQEAVALAGARSQLTFEQLDTLIREENVSIRDLEELLDALANRGIRVVEE